MIESELKEKGPQDIDKILDFAKNYSFCTNPDYLELRKSNIIDRGIYKSIFETPEQYNKTMKNILLSRRYNLVNELLID